MASVTAFARRYRSDLFLRTEVNIAALQIAYAAIILAIAIGALVLLYHEIVAGVIAAIASALTSSAGAVTPDTIARQLEAARTREIVGISSLIFGAAVAFGYLISRLALLPTRNALASQKQFIGNIAHELRTPLSIIKANTEIRLLDGNVPAAARTFHEENLEELDRISDIINNLLTLNTLVQPERVAFTNVDVSKVAHRAVEQLSPLARKKPLKIKIRSARVHTAWGNAAALEQILMNLIRNAIQHTERGEILISIGPDDHGHLELTIRDSGSGISRKDLVRIFEPFYRGDRARTRTGGAGSGLGLAIVSELVKLHRGRVSIRSAPGEGTTVTIILPPGHTGETTEASESADQNIVSADFTGG